MAASRLLAEPKPKKPNVKLQRREQMLFFPLAQLFGRSLHCPATEDIALVPVRDRRGN